MDIVGVLFMSHTGRYLHNKSVCKCLKINALNLMCTMHLYSCGPTLVWHLMSNQWCVYFFKTTNFPFKLLLCHPHKCSLLICSPLTTPLQQITYQHLFKPLTYWANLNTVISYQLVKNSVVSNQPSEQFNTFIYEINCYISNFSCRCDTKIQKEGSLSPCYIPGLMAWYGLMPSHWWCLWTSLHLGLNAEHVLLFSWFLFSLYKIF
jgi:hypothetical protein